MSDHWTIRVDDDDARIRVERLALFMQDLRGFWPLLIPRFIRWMGEQFDSEGGFAGARWAPLNPDYLAAKVARGGRSEILQDTGALRQAASQPQRTVTPTSLILTIDDPKLEFLQEGTDRMPARPLLFGDPLPFEAQADIEEAATTYIADLLGRV